MNIPQPERGGNGESMGVVNDWLLWRTVPLRGSSRTPGLATVAPNHQLGPILFSGLEFF
jgi:hypothetical protein